MRYYDIKIFDPTTGKIVREYTTLLANGQTDPGALQLKMDLPVASFATPMGTTGAWVQVWGIPLADIAQSSNLNGMRIEVYGGMQKGLPLANPAQAGLLVAGLIFQCFGTWIGVNMTLDFIIYPDSGTPDSPKNIIHNWTLGTSLAASIKQTLVTAFPGYTVNINISPNLILAYPDQGYYQTLAQYAQFIKQRSIAIVGGTYQGVDIVLAGRTFTVTDGTTQGTPKQISYLDLIGQPTWRAQNEIQVTCVMRADIAVNNYVQLPKTLTTTTQPGAVMQSGQSADRQNSVFQGVFRVYQMRHVGDFRSPAGESWITALDCFTVPPSNQKPTPPAGTPFMLGGDPVP